MLYEEITSKIINLAIEVHKELGPGLLESVYSECLFFELVNAGIAVKKELELPVNYKNCKINCGYRMDMVVDGNVLIELKSVEKILKIHEAQTLTYLKLSGIKVGLLINFNSIMLKDGIKRFIL